VKCHLSGNELDHGEGACHNWMAESMILCHSSYSSFPSKWHFTEKSQRSFLKKALA